MLICQPYRDICSHSYVGHMKSALHNSVHNSGCDRSASACHKLPVRPVLVVIRPHGCHEVLQHYKPLNKYFGLPFCPLLQLRKETYSRLTPTQRLQVARHPNRPTCLDIILNITGTAAVDRLAGLCP